MSKSILKFFACLMAAITAVSTVGFLRATENVVLAESDGIYSQMYIIGRSAKVAGETLNSEVHDYEFDDPYETIVRFTSLSDSVYIDDYADVSEIGNAAIAKAVADYKAEQARIAAEKAAAEEAARRQQATKPSVKDVATEQKSRPDMVGRLYIPSINMTPVACIDSYQQSVTDAEDSANIWFMDSGLVIADHVHQNFSPLKHVRVGTTATIDCGTATYTLECVEVNPKFYCGPWGDFCEAFDLSSLDNYVVMYTCNGWPYVTATLWRVTSGGFNSLYSRVTQGE